MKKSWVLLVLAVVLSTFLIVNCARPVPQPPAPPTTPTAVGGVGQAVLNWNQVPGATGYQVQYQPLLGSGQRGWTTIEVAAPPYTLEEEPGNYEWQVRTKKGNLFSEWVNGPAFGVQEDPGPSDLILTLNEVPARGVPTIFVVSDSPAEAISARAAGLTNINYLLAQVISTVPGLETVAYYVQKVGSQDQKRWPDSATTYELDEDGEHVFGINDLGANFNPNLAVGQYWFWVQGTGDQENIRSNKVRFDIALVGSGEIEIVKKIDDTVYEGKICAPEGEEVEVDFYVDFTFADNLHFLEYLISFQASDPSTSDSEVGEGAPESAVFSVLYEYECTKYATVTLDATLVRVYWDWVLGEVDDGELAIKILKAISFVLDTQAPTGTANVVTLPSSLDDRITAATITFVASDTKCLQPYAEKISFEFNIYKGEGSWNETVWFYDEEFIIGEGSEWDNEISVTAAYDTDFDEFDQATAVFVLQFGALDAATVTATMTAADCCVGCLDCSIPEDPCEPWDMDDAHMTQVAIEPFFIDNVFFSTLLDDDFVIQHDGFIEVEGREVPTVPASPTEAWFQLIFADANWDPDGDWDGAWDDIDNIEVDIDFDGNYWEHLVFGFSATRTTEEAVCAGYSTKIVLILEATVTAHTEEEPIETTVTFNATATDDADNEHVVSFTVFVDTMPPTLTYFRAFRNPDIDESKIEFRFHEEPFDVELVLSDGDEEFPLDFTNAIRIGSPDEFMYRLFPNITIQSGIEYTLRAKATDAAGNTGESQLSHTAAMAATR